MLDLHLASLYILQFVLQFEGFNEKYGIKDASNSSFFFAFPEAYACVSSCHENRPAAIPVEPEK